LLLGKGQRQEGYLVPTLEAVALLREVNPEAAHWWQEKTPHLLAPGKSFLFAAEACREVAFTEARAEQWPPAPRDDRYQG
jgi:hypothetical protein